MSDLAKLLEQLASQAVSGQQQGGNSGGLGGILGGVLGSLGGNQQQSGTSSGGLGGILGSVLGQVTGNNNSGNGTGLGAQSLLIAVVPLILNWIQQQGGLSAALDQLKGAGLGQQVQSWVDPSQSNSEHVEKEHIQSLFDDQSIAAVAEQTQTDKSDVYSAISTVLPQVIDSLTPKGENTDQTTANSEIQNVLNLASNFFK
ncbi:MAG: YidB family protein [Acinetobacter sp.]